MKNLVLALTLLPMFAQAESYARPQGYDAAIPNASERAKDPNTWKPFPGFDTIHLVEENTGKPEAKAVQALTDNGIKADIAQGYYKSLQVRDLYIKKSDMTGSTLKIPYAVSVKHSYAATSNNMLASALSTVNQGTLEVVGFLNVTVSDKVVKVTVTAFDDSQPLESYGRYVGANHGTDLEFARRIVVPTLEAYFQNPENVGRLLGQEIPTKL